jgi:tyrosine-protein phosphatase SIW14
MTKFKILLCLTLALASGCASHFHVEKVSPGIYRGSQPRTDADWKYLAHDLHVTNEVKLNMNSEGSDAGAIANGIRVTYIPISFCQQTIGEPSRKRLQEAVQAIGPGTFIHCSHGQDRTGLVVGLYRVQIEHWGKQRAYSEMAAHGFHPLLRGLYWAWEEQP